jgi:hypothetical protein
MPRQQLLKGANPEKARQLAAENSPAGSPEAEKAAGFNSGKRL